MKNTVIDRISRKNVRSPAMNTASWLALFALCVAAFSGLMNYAAAGDSPAITFTVSTSGAFKHVKWKSAAPAGANMRICFMKDYSPLFCEDVQEGMTSGTVRVTVGMPVEECTAEFVGRR